MIGHGDRLRRPVLTPVASGVGAFGAFYAAALVARRIPVLERAIGSVLSYADQGSGPLGLASVPMGLLFAQQRRITGGIQAPMLTHVVWSALMLRYLPPLFADQLAEERSPSPG